MTSDAERFRPRDHGSAASPPGSVSEQTPPTPPSAFGARDVSTAPAPGSAQYAPPRYAPPDARDPHLHLAGRDAQLIHPAAARASSATPYGVPVYHAPVYALEPQPSRGLSISAMVLGLISVTFGWTLVVVPMIGIVFGFLALRREPAGRAMAITGLITSCVGLLWVLLFYVLPLVGVLAGLVFALGVR